MLHDEGGAGPPILLLHGLMGSARTWARHLDWFRGFGRIYTFDAPGHGRPAPNPPATAAFVDELAVATAAIAQPLVVVGHSMGALHGWMFAAAWPERVRALVIEDMAPDFRGRTADGWAALINGWPQPFPSAEAVLEYFGPVAGQYFLESLHAGPGGYRLHGTVAVFQAISAEWGERSFWPEWESLQVPALLLEAEHSITPPGQMRAMARRHPSTYVRISGAGHLIHDEQPSAYRAAVGQFLAGQCRAHAAPGPSPG